MFKSQLELELIYHDAKQLHFDYDSQIGILTKTTQRNVPFNNSTSSLFSSF